MISNEILITNTRLKDSYSKSSPVLNFALLTPEHINSILVRELVETSVVEQDNAATIQDNLKIEKEETTPLLTTSSLTAAGNGSCTHPV